MKIQEINYQNNEMHIETDSNYSFIISINTSLEYPLDEGQEISEELITEIMYYDMTEKARILALKFISKRLRTEKEIKDYIRARGYDEIVSENVIEYLKSYDYIDDEEYARAFIRDRVNLKKHGRERIAYELSLKGVDREIINHLMPMMYKEELPNALKLIRARYSLSDNPRKMVNFLKQRGYPYQVIDEAIRIFQNA